MNFKDLLKNCLLGFLPLIVFVGADAVLSKRLGPQEGLKWAIAAALVFGVLQAIFVYLKEKRFEKFLLFDTGLILLFGGVSLVSQNELFFKLKPAFVQTIMVVMIGVVAFFKPGLFLTFAGRFAGQMRVTPAQLKSLQNMAKWMFLIFGLHTGFVFYAAFEMSKEAWAFISGGLFYILFGVYFAVTFFLARKKRKMLFQDPAKDWAAIKAKKRIRPQ